MRIQSKVLKNLVEKREKNEQKAFRQSLYRLKRDGFVKELSNDFLELDYKKYLSKKATSVYFEKSKDVQGVMIMFDIPEEKKNIRDWLRRQLISWDFIMIQKSVWFGRGKLTKDFKNHLELLGIKDNLKIFSATQIKV